MGEPQRRCSSCGESYAEGVIFCPRDGNALSTRGSDGGPDPYLGRTLHGAFRVDALIGTGAVGRVYRALQLGIERNVALKIMHRDLAANEALQSRFRREARIAGSLDHPNLVNVLLLSEVVEGALPVPFLVLEYLDGLSLRSALLARGALPAARTVHVLLQIADAVGAAHQRGIVHRDLKPENVMLVQRGDDSDFVKVLDFGVAHAEPNDPTGAPTVATRAGAIFGSARYVAPECAAGGASSPASDVYALATLGYECLCGATPFEGDNAISVLLQQQSKAVPPLRERAPERAIPSALALFLERNLAKAPAERAQDARLFARELLAVASDSGVDPGWSARTRRGHAVSVQEAPSAPRIALETRGALRSAPDASDAPFLPARSLAPLSQTQSSTARRALFMVACFVLGAGAALGIATKLGAFAEKASAPASSKATP